MIRLGAVGGRGILACTAIAVLSLVTATTSLDAQGTDTTVRRADTISARQDTIRRDTVRIDTTRIDSIRQPITPAVLTKKLPSPDSLKPPLSPGKAFLTSLLLPGYAQSRLNRPTATIVYAAVEVVALGMLRKSAQDLRVAKNNRQDSLIIGYTIGTGGTPIPTYGPGRFTADRIKARRTHYEDWLAVIVFNHLISAADAYVAANLWDFDANVSLTQGQRRAAISVRRSF